MQVETTQYIFPPRPQDSIPRSETQLFSDLGWVAQLKYNGSRCLIKYTPDGDVELWNRHGERFRSYTAPDWIKEQLLEVRSQLGLRADEVSILDGEMIDAKHKALKDTIAIWDILVADGEHLTGTTYAERYSRIFPAGNTLGDLDYTFSNNSGSFVFGTRFKNTEDIFAPVSQLAGSGIEGNRMENWDNMWDMVHSVNAQYKTASGDISPLLEGLVFKDPHGILAPGWKEKNNGDWMVRSRVKTGRHLF